MKIYDENFPLNSTLNKDIPKSIREKGQELYNLITDIENHRTTSSIKNSIEVYPYMNELFVNGNETIPRGLYFNHGNYWVGYNDYESLPTDITNVELGKRITIDNQTFELKETENIKVWSISHSFQPILFYDLFEYENESNIELDNRGIYKDNVKLAIENMYTTKEYLPYLRFSKDSKMYTKNSIICPYSFTFSAMFDNISRIYHDETQMNINHYSVLIYIKDEFSNINLCLCYDKYNHLYLYNNDVQNKLNFIISENVKYQISLQYINEHLDVYIDNEFIKSIPIKLVDKMLYFSIGSDMNYGRFAAGSFIIAEPNLYKEALSIKEIMHTKNFPRTWNLGFKNSYLDLTLDEKIKLKELLKARD